LVRDKWDEWKPVFPLVSTAISGRSGSSVSQTCHGRVQSKTTDGEANKNDRCSQIDSIYTMCISSVIQSKLHCTSRLPHAFILSAGCRYSHQSRSIEFVRRIVQHLRDCARAHDVSAKTKGSPAGTCHGAGRRPTCGESSAALGTMMHGDDPWTEHNRSQPQSVRGCEIPSNPASSP
jgi:hypothetical protein